MYVASRVETLKAFKMYSWSLCCPWQFQTTLGSSNRSYPSHHPNSTLFPGVMCSARWEVV